MRPQGFLGRALAQRRAGALRLPPSTNDWSDRHVLRALTTFGDDLVGNLLLGDAARDRFLSAGTPKPIARSERATAYARLAALASQGELADANPVSTRWRDLLLAEQLALESLRRTGVPAARSAVLHHGTQCFLELERFDRVGERGRRALHSLGRLDDEFVGDRAAPWPVAVRALVDRKVVQPQALGTVERLYAFGVLIGNTDMHMGNLSFLGDSVQPYELAPAYDMLPMAFAPSAAGALRDELPPLRLPRCVPLGTWPQVLPWALDFISRLRAARDEGALSPAFRPCVEALAARLAQAQEQIGRTAACWAKPRRPPSCRAAARSSAAPPGWPCSARSAGCRHRPRRCH